MCGSRAGYAGDIRPLRGPVPACADSSLPAVTVSLQAGLYTYKGSGADALQRPLRSRFRARLTAGVRCPGCRKPICHNTSSHALRRFSGRCIMLQTPLCTLLGIEFPNIQAGMGAFTAA